MSKTCPRCGGDPLTDEAITAEDPFEGTDNPCVCAPMFRGGWVAEIVGDGRVRLTLDGVIQNPNELADDQVHGWLMALAIIKKPGFHNYSDYLKLVEKEKKQNESN